MSNTHQVCVSWDFTQETKNKYFSETISGLGDDLFFSFQDSCCSFFEVLTFADTNACIYEANSNLSLNIKDASKPFIYIKNIGYYNLILKASNSGQLFSYRNDKLNNIFESLSGDYLIGPQENLILTVNVSTDGSQYFSKACYPFGFYYDFDNINEVNRGGSYPVCFGDSRLPIYSYESFNLDDSFTLCETNPNEQIYNTTYYISGNFDYAVNGELGRVECHPETSGKWSLYLYTGGLSIFPNANQFKYATTGEAPIWPPICECPNYSGNMFCIFSESGKRKNLISSGYIKPEKFPESGKYAPVLSINNNNNEKLYIGPSGEGYFNNLNLDLLRIDHEGYIQFGTSNCFYVTKCEIISGFCFDGNLGLNYNYNSGEFNFGCDAAPCYGGGYFNFKIKPFNGFYITGEKQFIFYSEQVCLYLESGKIILDKCDGFKATGISIETGFCNCIGINTIFDTFFESINPSEICNFKLNNWGLRGISSSNGLDLCASYKCCYNGVNGLWNLSNTGCSYNFILGMTDSGTNVFLGEIIDFTLIKQDWATGLRIETKNKVSGDFSIVSGLDHTGSNIFPTYAFYTELCKPEFGFARSECPLVLNQWNDYQISVLNCNYAGSPTNDFCILIQGSSIGSAGGVWSCTLPTNERIIPYQMPKNISGICSLEGDLQICDIYSFEISSIQDEKSEYFYGLLSDVFLCFQFFEGGLYYDDSTTINFDFKCKNFIGKKHSFNFNSIVDECARLSLYNSGKSNAINKETKICSLYGGNFYQGSICINSLKLSDDNNLLNDIDLNNYECAFFISEIKTGCNLFFYYDIDFSSSKNYSYIYCLNAPEFSSEPCLISNFFGLSKIYNFESGCMLSPNLTYKVTGDGDTCFFINLNLKSQHSLNTISGLYFKKSCMFLPPVDSIPYCYCFQIANVNNSFPILESGNWISSGSNLCIQEYVNYTEIVSIYDSNYINCCSSIYEIELDFSKSKKRTSDIACKTEDSIGEPFFSIFDICEEIFYYSGLEYRYTPICSIIFRCNEYILPDKCINMQILSSGNLVSFDFPIRAINQDKIKITAESQVIETIDSSVAKLDYQNFFLEFCESNSSYYLIKVPKISSGTISPDFSFDAKTCSKIENSINFYIDPYFNFKDDSTYGMNNFLFFIASQLNSGLVYCCNFSGFDYSDSDYNSFMVDLKNEFYDCCYQIPSGSGKFLIDSRISFENLDLNQPLLFKSISGSGYNFILPVATGLSYVDCTNQYECGVVCNVINITTGLNYCNNKILYSGGQTGFRYTGSGDLTLEIYSGFLTGNNDDFYTGFLCTTSIQTFPNCYSLYINCSDISQTVSGRSICLIKSYTYSGVQPVVLTSNYPLQQIKNNLIFRDFSEYCSLCFNCSGLFYYIYDIVNNKNTNLKIISPDLTYFNTVCWSDDRGFCNYLCFLCSDNQYGQLQKNVASLRYMTTQLTQNNVFCFSNDASQIINLDIREDL